MKENLNTKAIAIILEEAITKAYITLEIGEPKKKLRKSMSKISKKLSREINDHLKQELKGELKEKKAQLKNAMKEEKKTLKKLNGKKSKDATVKSKKIMTL